MKVPAAILIGLLGTLSSLGQTPQKVKLSDFKLASSCQPCHEQIYAQWQTSTHSKAFVDPLYQAVVRKAVEQSKGGLTQFCVSCHAPLATVTSSIPPDLFQKEQIDPRIENGVTCEFCHTISGTEVNLHKVSLGAFLFPRAIQTKILYGRHADATNDAHPTQPSPFLLSAELCGTCHRFGHPVSGMPVQDTYQEWKQSPYAAQGTRCQDCHMPSYQGKVSESGKERSEIHAHIFRGGHTEMIRQAAIVNITASRISKDALDASVVVTNVGAGHMIPTGLPAVREMWLEVTVQSQGKILSTQKRVFGLEVLNAEGKPTLPWEATKLGKDTRIAPKKSRLEKFRFEVSGSENIRIEAKLQEQLLSDQAAKFAGVPPSPPQTMAETSISLPQ